MFTLTEMGFTWAAIIIVYLISVTYMWFRNIQSEKKLKKDHEDQLAKERIECEGERVASEKCLADTYNRLCNKSIELGKERKSNSANQGWNVKYRRAIEDLKRINENTEFLLKHEKQSLRVACADWKKLAGKNKEQQDTIKRLNTALDESYIAINAVGNEPKKTKRLELLDKYMNK